jgi:hypothetical protein
VSLSRRSVFLGLLAGLLSPASAQAPAGPYLFDLMKQPAFRASWDRLFAGAPGIEPWLRNFSRTLNGVTAPSARTTADGRSFIIADVCKPRDCADNFVAVLFTADGRRAWAVLATPGRQRWFGDPGPLERDLLAKRLL